MDSDDEDSNDGMSMLPMMSFLLLASLHLKWVTSPMRDILSLESVRARQGKILRASLQDPSRSSFWTLYNSGQDDALIALCGFDHAAFQSLLQSFQDLYYSYRPVGTGGVIKKMKQCAIRRGRPRHLCATSCLALYLVWTRTQGKQSILGMLFGLMANQVSIWICFARRLLILMFLNDKRAKVKMPTMNKVESFKTSMSTKYCSLCNVCGAMDGLKLRLQKAGDHIEQSMFITTGHTAITSAVCFCFSQMERLGLPTSTRLERTTILCWQTWEDFMRKSTRCIAEPEGKLL